MDLIVSGETIRLSPQHIERSELLRGFAEVMPGEPFTLPPHPKVTVNGVRLFFDMLKPIDYPSSSSLLERLWAAEVLCADVPDEDVEIQTVITFMTKANSLGGGVTLRQKTEYLRTVYETGQAPVVTGGRKKKQLPIFQWSLLTSFLPPSFAFKVYSALFQKLSNNIRNEIIWYRRGVTSRVVWGKSKIIHVAYRSKITVEKTIRRHRNVLMEYFRRPYYNRQTDRLERCDCYVAFKCMCRKVDHFCTNKEGVVDVDKWVVVGESHFSDDEFDKNELKTREYFHETRFDYFQDVWFKSFERSPFDACE